MIHFVGAGSGAPDLITLRGAKYLAEADCIIYAGSLVNPELLDHKKEGCLTLNSATMTLAEVIAQMEEMESQEKITVRLHTGDPCLYGAIGEQMELLDLKNIPYTYTPGVSSFCGAAAALKKEYTLPQVSQTVIISRMAGRTPVPEKEDLRLLASHGCTMVLFLSTGLIPSLVESLLQGAYTKDTPAALVYKATWDEEQVHHCTLATLEETARRHNITKTALITVGDFLQAQAGRSKLYDPKFTTEFREGQP